MKRTVYTGRNLEEISFPLGGIGTGSIGLAGNGALIDWEIQNRAAKGTSFGYSHFAVKAAKNGKCVDARILTGDYTKGLTGQYGKDFGFGLSNGTMAGFPHFRDCTFCGEYPIAVVDLSDPDFPGKVQLTAFNPLIPRNPKDSGIPAAFLSYAITNTTEETLDYTFAATINNPRQHSVNRLYQENGISYLYIDNTDKVRGSFDYFDMTFATDTVENVRATASWYRIGWCDGRKDYWRNFINETEPHVRSFEMPGSYDCGTIYVRKTAKPGETVVFRNVLSWHCPNRRNTWDKYTEKNEAGEEIEIPMKNYYSTIFEDSRASAAYALREWDRLWKETKKYHDALFASTVPEEVLDAVSATTSVLKTETCLRIGEKGDFYGWEGLKQNEGSCPGTCSHVWNYAYAMCFLFPELERNIRENEYHYDLRPAGDLSFRTRIPFGREPGTFRACVDGQMGSILKIYREWKLLGDNTWLASLWPLVRKSLEFTWSAENFDRWDLDHDGVLEGRQHHTLDTELFGPSSWLEGFYLSALKASAEMARVMGEDDFAKECSDLYMRGKAWSDENLFNGKYFIQKINLTDKAMLESYKEGVDVFGHEDAVTSYWNEESGQIKYQIGDGCAIDQLLAQWHADILGLGDIFDPEKVDIALKNMYQNNFKETMRDHWNTYRLFALNDESGAVICDYPEGVECPEAQVECAQECMTGFEYAFAGLLISRGYLDEGFRVVRGVRDRYNGFNRNPWNEIECGSNYARSMASFALLPILSGMKFDMTKQMLGFYPKIEKENFTCIWNLDSGWGQIHTTKTEATLSVFDGSVTLKVFALPFLSSVTEVLADGKPISFAFDKQTGNIIFEKAVIAEKEIKVCSSGPVQ